MKKMGARAGRRDPIFEGGGPALRINSDMKICDGGGVLGVSDKGQDVGDFGTEACSWFICSDTRLQAHPGPSLCFNLHFSTWLSPYGAEQAVLSKVLYSLHKVYDTSDLCLDTHAPSVSGSPVHRPCDKKKASRHLCHE